MGDHTETIEIDFDPTIISYEQLLQIFWKSHNPCRGQSYGGRQYMSILLYHNEKQKEVAFRTMEQVNGDVQTEVSSYSKFYVAEDYHQKYYLKRYQKAMSVVQRLFPTEEEITNATLTARLNGLVKGYITMEKLKEEIRAWNLAEGNVKNVLAVLDEIRW